MQNNDRFGYNSPPTVSFVGGGGSGARATAVISGVTVVEIEARLFPCFFLAFSCGFIYILLKAKKHILGNITKRMSYLH